MVSKKKDPFVPKSQADELTEAFRFVTEKVKKAVEVRERSGAVKEAFQYVIYLYLEHISSALTKNAFHKELTDWEKLIIYSLRTWKLSRTFG